MFKVGRILSLSLFILLILTVAVQAYSIGSHTLCKDIDETPTPDRPIDPTHTFYDTDQQVCLLVILENVDRSYGVYTKWLTPDGNLFKKDDYVTPDPRAEGYPSWEILSTNSKLFLQDEDANAKIFPGQWKVEFYISDELQFTDSFELKSTHSYSIRSHTTCKGVDESEYPYKPIDSTTIFYDTDERVYCLVILENVYGSHVFESRLFNPIGNQYNSSKKEIPDARTTGYDYWTTYSMYTIMPIRGMEAANLHGQWRIEGYIDNQLKFQIDFQIVSTKPTETQTSSQQVQTTEVISTSTVMTSIVTQTIVAEPFSVSSTMVIIGLIAIIVIVATWLVMRSRSKPRPESVVERFCIECGEPLRVDQKYCPRCGKAQN